MELLLMDEDEGKQHFNLDDLVKKSKKLSKRQRLKQAREKSTKKVVEDNFDVRFDPLFT